MLKLRLEPLGSLQFSTLVELEPEKDTDPSVCPHFSRVTAARILPKLGQKLKGDE